ncbi:MAG: uncharacterized protein QOI40_100 [Alphaproteobacteria bacterium]|nr:uncharacterized protein [Alphaproteobacteria bacterium]
MSTDDLNTPLGVTNKKKKKRFVLPPGLVSRVLAGVLGLCVAVLAGWILFVDEPFGGEPMVIVSAFPAPKPADGAAAQKPDIAAPPPASLAASGDRAQPPPPGAETITIIDGSTGKRQEVTVAQPGVSLGTKFNAKTISTPATAIDPRLLETTRHGSVPKISPDGARPSDIYARPVKPQASRANAPRVAIVIEGLGMSSNTTSEALAKLPPPVTFAFTPYGTDIERWINRARSEGHEVVAQVGMEPFDYPDSDPGPQTLLASMPAENNLDRLMWFLSRFQGYVGVTSLMGGRFTATETAFGPVMNEIGKRGLIYFDDGSSPRSVAGQISGANNAAFAKADAVLDAVPTQADIDNALARLEATARSRGVAIASASALPITIDRIALWARGAEDRGIILVPLSSVAVRPKTAT